MPKAKIVILEGKAWEDVVKVYGDSGTNPATVNLNWPDIEGNATYNDHTALRGKRPDGVLTGTGFLQNQTGQVIARVLQFP